ncbi:MAG: N-acetylmuramoyl-L-alanine amidase, partial [Flavobacteriales bacterium]
QDQFRTRVGRKDRGVKQAGYYVISFTNMPSILVELGFLTNADEEDFLHSDEGKTYMASAIYRAFRDFKEKESPSAKPPVDEPVKVPEITAGKTEKKTTPAATDSKQEPEKKQPAQPPVVSKTTQTENAPAKTETKPVEKADNSASTQHKAQPEASTDTKNENNPTGLVINKPSDVPSKIISKGVKFQIQILTSAKSLKTTDAIFKGINNVEEYTHNGVYKYLSGTTDKYEEAKLIRDKLVEFGFKDAFIVAFEDDVRIDLAKAVNLTQKK